MRYLTPHIHNDLRKKMVFVGGPRQVGKTTMAKGIFDAFPEGGRYFNWDFDDDRRDIMAMNGEIETLIEVKYSDENISRSLRYYVDRLQPKNAVQIVANLKRSYSSGPITVTDPISYFSDSFYGKPD